MQVPEAALPAAPKVVRALTTPEAAELARLAAVFEDLQHVLRCCEHLVRTLQGGASRPGQAEADAALAEALWTAALIAYGRCFSERTAVLTPQDLAALELPGDLAGFHALLLHLRDHYTSPDTNPRETLSVGVAEGEDAAPAGVAVMSAPQPAVDEGAVRQLGAIAYGLSGVLHGRMQQSQEQVLAHARSLSREQFAALPVVPLTG